MERLFGVETEYAVGNAADGSWDRYRVVGQLLDVARDRLPHLPDARGAGMFLENGSRLYIDCGHHPELATPECSNPWEIVRLILAGEKILTGLAAALAEAHPAAGKPLLFKCNVDYSGSGSTWGCHESYLYGRDPGRLPPQLIPHLVSRLIYTGAGGFNSLSPGIDFTLSPRVPHLPLVISPDSTASRGIFHSKDESLSSPGYHRLHLLCGESLCSEMATWLKVGTTALVVALIDGGVFPGTSVELRSPVAAMRRFASDPELKAVAERVDGRTASALQIQRHYLTQVEAHASRSFMPPWTVDVCRGWRAILDRLERGPRSVEGTLDWSIKRAL